MIAELNLTCLYCDHKWSVYAYSEETVYKCPLCSDTNIKQSKKPERYNVFGYEES